MSVLGIETTGAISLLPREVCVTEDKLIQNYLFSGLLGARVHVLKEYAHIFMRVRLAFFVLYLLSFTALTAL